jgi:L-ornithine N5-monooxygenase
VICEIGVGLGPANLALLGALVEEPHSPTTADIRFVERAATIEWHSAFQVNDARVQIPFVKDLATLRSPRSVPTI